MTSLFQNFASRLVLAASFTVAASLGVAAQGLPGNGGTTGGPPGPQATTAVPLDGGASLLLAGGVAYGLRRLRQKRQRP